MQDLFGPITKKEENSSYFRKMFVVFWNNKYSMAGDVRKYT